MIMNFIIYLNHIHDWNYFDWYYYTDDLTIESKQWNIINDTNFYNLIQVIHNNDFNRMKSKFVKTNFIDLLNKQNKYKYIIWLDASIDITNINIIRNILNLLSNDKDFYIYEHYIRNKIYDEYLLSITMEKYKNQSLGEQINYYIKDNYNDNKLYESGIFICKNNDLMKKCMIDWWNEIKKYGYQCQISLPYVLNKNNIIPYLLNDNEFKKGYLKGSVWDNKLFGNVRNHNNE